ncbi:hypothetical protein OAA91_01330 [Fibrobacterales bacterium]|nr:hypothetical protein [Fibrobacterales bacterium]
MTKTLWIDGWACNSNFKKDELSLILKTEITILTFEDWIIKSNNNTLVQATSFDNIIFWSTACFSPIDFSKTSSNCIFLFPAFNYCGKEGWSTTAISRMQRNISKGNLEQTLEQFCELLSTNLTSSDKESWKTTALKNPLLLIQGLELLKEKSNIKPPLSSHIIIGDQDHLCKPQPIKSFIQELNLKKTGINSEHWPFHSIAYQALSKVLKK